MVLQQNQNIIDVAIQHCGAVQSIFDLAVANDLCVTDRIDAGVEIALTPAQELNIAAYFANNNIVPANEEPLTDTPQIGIGFWRIGVDFKVS